MPILKILKKRNISQEILKAVLALLQCFSLNFFEPHRQIGIIDHIVPIVAYM